MNIEGVSKQYNTKNWGLRDFTLELRPGVLGLLGPNGAGKSTLMRILATITKATSGRVTWNGTDIAKAPDVLRVDMFFAALMTYAAISGWLAWKRVIHSGLWHRLMYAFLTVYFTASIPLHAQTFIKGSTDFFRLFPEEYSLFSIPLMLVLLVFVWRLKFESGLK
jgi:energy-coupling factor transporter ATP-binding protein EcfA2